MIYENILIPLIKLYRIYAIIIMVCTIKKNSIILQIILAYHNE